MKGKKIVSTLLALLLLASLPVSAHAATWDIGKGDITVNAESGGQTVRQGGGAAVPDSAPVITGTSKENNVTINADSGQTASVTLSGVNIDVRDKGKAAVSTTGEGNVSIELNGGSTLRSGYEHAGLEKNNGGSLTIADEDKNGKLTAWGGQQGAGIGGGSGKDGSNIFITGGGVNAIGGLAAAGIGGGLGGNGSNITISGGKVGATNGLNGAGIGGGQHGSGSNITISGGEVNASGGKMYVHRTNNGRRISQYTCSNYTKVPCGTLCPTQHRINESAVLTLVSDTLRAIAEYSRNDRTEFIHTVQETQVAQQSADISKKCRRLAAAQKRAGELEKLICKIYEDNALGKLPDARYRALDAQYAKEQDALEIEIAELEKAVTGYEQSQKSAEKFIALIDKYENFDTLTNTMLNEFVEKILVHERSRKGSQDTTQEIEIYFNFLGRYIPPALQPVPLTPEEQEELRKKEERKDRLHQNYLRRKANGKQKEWEERYTAKRKAQVEAAKAAIRAEDMEKGIFTTISQLPRQEPRKATLPASAAV